MDRIEADLEVLWDKADNETQSLPEVAGDLEEAALCAGRAVGDGAGAFAGELYAGVASHWEELAGDLARILRDSAETMHDAAAALKLTVVRYAEADRLAAGVSDEIMREIDHFADGLP